MTSVQTLMDEEPVRCRRTDGRKWRCRLPVVPDQKYCTRHVHRGRRLCSRKPVELDQTFLKSKSKSKLTATTSISFLKTSPNLQSHAKTNHNKVSIKNQSLKIKKHNKSLEFTFSKKSVLPHGNELGCGASSADHKTGQYERCRRTDGKKWRCKKDVLPGLKYCMQHLHRGVKKAERQKIGDDGNQPKDSGSSNESTAISI